MATVFIALGSNLSDPLTQANQAIAALADIKQSRLVAVSPFYRSKPLGPQNQPDYLNAVIELETELSPQELLQQTQRIEQQQGRERKAERWGPRTLDLDILLYDQLIMQSQDLTIPHYDMHRREFMLYPLYDLRPDLILPDGTPLSTLLQQVPRNNLQQW